MANALLSPEKRQTIQNEANEILRKYSSFENQFDLLQKIINAEGIRLSEAPLHDLSGMLLKQGDGVWTIMVNQDDSRTRKLFTIAHELGHYFLHKDDQNQFIDGQFVQTFWGRAEDTKSLSQETEANEFAGNLIMPKEIIGKELEAHKGKAVSALEVLRLAEKFGVSPLAMATRLKNLDYELEQQR